LPGPQIGAGPALPRHLDDLFVEVDADRAHAAFGEFGHGSAGAAPDVDHSRSGWQSEQVVAALT
jgi:hypothetical protein